MNAFDVRIYTIRRRKGRRRPFEVRWQAAGGARSKSFLTRGLADSHRAELVRAARQGLEFHPATGQPLLWAVPGPAATTWLGACSRLHRHEMAAPGAAFAGQPGLQGLQINPS